MATLSKTRTDIQAHNKRVISLLKKENPLLARVMQRIEGESFSARKTSARASLRK